MYLNCFNQRSKGKNNINIYLKNQKKNPKKKNSYE